MGKTSDVSDSGCGIIVSISETSGLFTHVSVSATNRQITVQHHSSVQNSISNYCHGWAVAADDHTGYFCQLKTRSGSSGNVITNTGHVEM